MGECFERVCVLRECGVAEVQAWETKFPEGPKFPCGNFENVKFPKFLEELLAVQEGPEGAPGA